jgi:hypothetical protein
MANFDLNNYELGADRLKRFWADPNNSDARIVTINHTTPADRSVSTWVLEARLYLSAGDQANDLPKTTGWAFEIDGGGGANRTSALENGESSAIFRCLANYIYPGTKERPSREEMQKVERGVTPKPAIRDYEAEASKLKDVDGLRWLYAQAKGEGASSEVLERLAEIAGSFSAEGEDSGNRGGLPRSKNAGTP